MLGAKAFLGAFSDIFLFPEGFFKKEPDQRMKLRRINKVGKFEVKKVKNKGAVSKNVVHVAISPRSRQLVVDYQMSLIEQTAAQKLVKWSPEVVPLAGGSRFRSPLGPN